jgi:threonine/homoserine/homoserine lactone efflux protein
MEQAAFQLVKAMGLGLTVAAPVGPMAVLCMRRTLVQGWRQGLLTGAGVAVGDGLYATVAAFGLAGIAQFALAYRAPLHLAAGLFLLYLGCRILWKSRQSARGDQALPLGNASTARIFASSVLLTLTNPPTIVMFAALFAALAPAAGFDVITACVTVAGVFLGSLGWWCVVTLLVSLFRHALGASVRRWIDRVAGFALALFGVVEIKRAI